MCLLNDIHKTNSGPIERALREADIEYIGQVHAHTTSEYRCCQYVNRGRRVSENGCVFDR